MKFSISERDFTHFDKSSIVIGVTSKGEFTEVGQRLNAVSDNYLSKMISKEAFKAKVAQTLLLPSCPGTELNHVIIVGCGDKLAVKDGEFRKMVANAHKLLLASSATQALYFLTEVKVPTRNLSWKIKQSAEVCYESAYRFETYKSDKKPQAQLTETVLFLPDVQYQKNAEKALKTGLAIAEGVVFTKDLANQPSNVCTPTYLAQAAQDLADNAKNIKLTILDEADMQKLGMNALLSVTKGTSQPAKFVTMEYTGGDADLAPIAFVGKGITFDTGGISLKPAESMVGMKYDMCGAATVLGVMKTVSTLKLPINVVCVFAAVENMPGGSASKPEDIVTSMSGQTIEIMNTDAEGRLVLCDALTYCERFNPSIVIDIATLTGAVVIALGTHLTAVLSNQDALANELTQAGLESYDRVWHMPIMEEYQEQLKSPFADMSNVGGRAAGTITAACFLSRFAKKFNWAHLDVAGTAAMMGTNDRYATGRPVPLLMQFLLNRAHYAES